MTRLQKAIRTIVTTCLNVRANESFLIISEESVSDVGEAVWKCAKRVTKHPVLLKYTNSVGLRHGLPSTVESSLQHADCVIILTPKLISEASVRQALENGTRIALLNKTDCKIIERSIDIDYKKMASVSRRLADVFSIGRTIHMTSTAGTDVTLNISGSKGIAETGLAKRSGELSRLPAGEARIVPNRRNIQGQIAIDRVAGQRKPLARPVILRIQKGHITQIQGGKEAEQLRRDVRKFGKNGRTVSELGIGTNRALSFGNSSQEDAKVLGAAHITIGQDQITRVQGKVNQPIKAIILNPSMTLDGKQIIDCGNIVI